MQQTWRSVGVTCLKGAALLAFVVAGTYLTSSSWYGHDTRVRASWPFELSWAADSPLVVTVTDTAGSPLGGTEVELGFVPADVPVPYRLAANYEQFETLDEAKTASAGAARLTAPPVRDIFEGSPPPESGDIALVVRVESGAFPTVVYRSFPIPSRAEVDLQTDRPLYESGDPVRLRGLALASDLSGPYSPTKTTEGPTARLDIEGPGGDVVYSEHPVVSPTGVVAENFDLAPDARKGEYTATIKVGGAEADRSFEVRDPTDRTRSSSTDIDDRNRDLDLSVWRRDGTRFRAGEPNEAVIAVRDSSGQPIREADVDILEVDAEQSPIATDLRTGADGRSRFPWTPSEPERSERPYNDEVHYLAREPLVEFRVDIELPSDERQKTTVDVPVASSEDLLVTPETPFPRAGDTVEFRVQLPDTETHSSLPDALPVVAYHDGRTVAATTIRVPEDAPPNTSLKGSLTLDQTARGLTHLIALPYSPNASGWEKGWTALWVRQRHVPRVDITVSDEPPRPGGSATVGLEFPPGNSETDLDDRETNFGVRAVDEELYALQRSADLPLAALLDEPVEAARAATNLQTTDTSHSASRFNAAAHGPTVRIIGTSEKLHPELDRERRRRWGRPWGGVVALIMLALMSVSTRLVWPHLDRYLLTGSRIGLAVGVSMGLPALGALLVYATESPLVALILAVAFVVLLIGGQIDAYRNARQVPFGRWAGTLLIQLFLAFILVGATRSEFAFLAMFLLLLPFCLHALAWSLVFVRRSRWWCVAASSSWLTATLAIYFLVYVSVQTSPGSRHQTQKFAHQKRQGIRQTARIILEGDHDSTRELPETRQNVRDTVFWAPEIRAEGGKTEFQMQLPDANISWRLEATAHTDNGNVGRSSTLLRIGEE